MSWLGSGLVPESGKFTIGEKNGDIWHEKENVSQGKKINRATFPEYRRYDLSGAALKSPQSMAYDSEKSAFIAGESGLASEFYEIWWRSGLAGVLTHLAELSKVKDLFQMIQEKVMPTKKIPEESIAEQFSSVPNWSKSVIRAFAVHPHVHSFAVGYNDDVVRIYSASRLNDFEPILKDKKQKNVTCLAFRPLSAAHIAVGCKSGIMFWILDPNSTGLRPGANQHRFLSQLGHHPVTSLAWARNGNLLASGSPADSSVVIWDVFLQRSTALRRLGPGICFLSWSPHQDCLFSSTSKDMFRIWKTRSWTCEKWSNLNGRCQIACWSSCQRYLLFTVENETCLYYLYFQQSKDSNGNVSTGSGVAIKCFDFAEYFWENEEVKVGGVLQSMAWDPTGNRLAMIFRDSDNPDKTHRHIGLFTTSLDPIFEIRPCGFITGYSEELPLAVSFLPNFGKGALLMVCWSTGMLSQIPLLFYIDHTTIASQQDDLIAKSETTLPTGVLQSIQ